MPARRAHLAAPKPSGELEATLLALREKNDVPEGFPDAVTREAEAAAPAERAAAIEALGELATSGPVRATDPLGHEGVELGGDGWSVILDPEDGSVLAFRSEAGPGGTSPAGSAWTVWNP